jgi:hypothetical protein
MLNWSSPGAAQAVSVRECCLWLDGKVLRSLQVVWLSCLLALQNDWRSKLTGFIGGSGEIRTHEGLTPSPVFKTGAFNRSATLP